jgi:hypothetical protein
LNWIALSGDPTLAATNKHPKANNAFSTLPLGQILVEVFDKQENILHLFLYNIFKHFLNLRLLLGASLNLTT